MDAFGDSPDPEAPDESLLQSEHAVNALLRMSKEHQGDINFLFYTAY